MGAGGEGANPTPIKPTESRPHPPSWNLIFFGEFLNAVSAFLGCPTEALVCSLAEVLYSTCLVHYNFNLI